MLLAIGIILFIVLILVHEWGHFIVARRNGVEVEEFGLFFPPRLKVLARRKGTEYTLNALPLGGFVRLKGETDQDRRPGSFGAASTWVKAKIMLAGVAMNFGAAFILLTILGWVGMPQLVDNQFTVASDTHAVNSRVFVGYVADGSPAEQAGLKEGDLIKSVNLVDNSAASQTIATAEGFSDATERYAGRLVEVSIERDGQPQQLEASLLKQAEVQASQDTDNPKGYIGVGLTEYTTQRSTWSAPIVAGGLMAQFTGLTFQGLGTAIGSLAQGDTTTASQQVSGPVGVFAILQAGSDLGFQFILLIVAIISLSLAIMNALPIPALDGGRLFVMLVSRWLGKPLTKRMEEAIHGVGFLFLISLIILITVVDVKRFF